MSPQISSQYGEHRLTSRWDLLASLGHPCKFQRVSRLGSVTARHSSSGCQPNFVALNRGRHLYSAGRPSRWALAHISSIVIICSHCIIGTEGTVIEHRAIWRLVHWPLMDELLHFVQRIGTQAGGHLVHPFFAVQSITMSPKRATSGLV